MAQGSSEDLHGFKITISKSISQVQNKKEDRIRLAHSNINGIVNVFAVGILCLETQNNFNTQKYQPAKCSDICIILALNLVEAEPYNSQQN